MPDCVSERLVRLAMSDQIVLVIPPDQSQPYPIPQLPMSQILWLEHLTNNFMAKHKRCMSVALMLDLSQRGWAKPEVPTQRCGPDGANWSWLEEDFAARGPDLRIAGSFQSAVLESMHEAMALVPPVDGLHVIAVHSDKPCVYGFLHVEGQTMAIDVKSIVIDDVAAALARNTKRLTLE